MTDKEIQELGWKTEDAFRKMLDRAKIPYLPFCDDIKKFSPTLRDFFGAKRPDVMILLRYVGFLLVDVKHKKTTAEHPDFLFNSEETQKYSHFREAFGHEVWYAISNTDLNFKKWFFVPALQVMKSGKQITTNKGDNCLAISPGDCIQTTSFQDLLRILFSS